MTRIASWGSMKQSGIAGSRCWVSAGLRVKVGAPPDGKTPLAAVRCRTPGFRAQPPNSTRTRCARATGSGLPARDAARGGAGAAAVAAAPTRDSRRGRPRGAELAGSRARGCAPRWLAHRHVAAVAARRGDGRRGAAGGRGRALATRRDSAARAATVGRRGTALATTAPPPAIAAAEAAIGRELAGRRASAATWTLERGRRGAVVQATADRAHRPARTGCDAGRRAPAAAATRDREQRRERRAARVQLAHGGAARRAVAQVRAELEQLLGRRLAVDDRRQQRRPALALVAGLDARVARQERAPALGDAAVDLRVRPAGRCSQISRS